MDKAQIFINMLSRDIDLAYDVETSGLDWKKCFVCGYALSDGIDSIYVPVRHHMGGNIENIEQFEQDIAKIIANRTKNLIGHNIKFDYHFSMNHGIILGNKIKDTMIREALINENRYSFSLENVCKNYNIIPKKGKDLYEHIARNFGCRPTRDSMGMFWRLDGSDPIVDDYARTDVLCTKQLYDAQQIIIETEDLQRIDKLESELSYVLQKMERRGISVDAEESNKVKIEVEKLYEDAYIKLPLSEIDLTPMNVRSSKDIKQYLEYMGIEDWPITEKGNPSFGKDFLKKFPEGEDILNVRKLMHFKSSFLDVMDNFIHEGKIHTTFNQAVGETHGTKSGRLSSNHPNLQQVPKRDKHLGSMYRKIFKAREDSFLIEFDYSQAEPRLYAHYSDEPVLIKGYNSTPFVDMHDVCAKMMSVTRDFAKSINLGILYTMGATKLAGHLGIDDKKAYRVHGMWHNTFKNVSKFTEQAATVANNRGYVRTILGRRARFPDPRWTYRAANRIIQGGSADIVKYKLVQIDKYLEENKLEDVCRMLLTIHDSIVFEINDNREDLVKEIDKIMCDVSGPPFNLKVPFVSDYKMGKNWSIATYGDTPK